MPDAPPEMWMPSEIQMEDLNPTLLKLPDPHLYQFFIMEITYEYTRHSTITVHTYVIKDRTVHKTF